MCIIGARLTDCHQSVGLIQRAIEARGVPTVSVTVARDITEAIKVPRALFLPWPMGHHFGAPFIAICSAALCSRRWGCLSPANNRVRYWISRSSGQTLVVRPKHSPNKGGSSSTANCAFPDRSRKVRAFIVSPLNGQDPEMQLRDLRDYCERDAV